MLPDCKTVEEYNEFITNLPIQDIPEVFGLHANADITYQINTAKAILDTILAVQPKEGGGGGGGESRETVVARVATVGILDLSLLNPLLSRTC